MLSIAIVHVQKEKRKKREKNKKIEKE